MRILCCVKRVPAPGAKINVTDDGMDVDAAHLGFTTSRTRSALSKVPCS